MPEFDPAPHSLGVKTRKGILDIAFAQVLRLGIQFASVIVLTAMLSPADFGVVAMASPFFGLVLLFQDLGLFQTAIQRPKISHDELTALFWLGLGTGIVGSVMLFIGAPFIGEYFRDPRVATLTAAMALFPTMNAIGGIHSAILTRRLEFRGLAVLEVATAVTSFGGAALAARAGLGFWSLYAGQVAAGLISMVGVWLICGWRPGLPNWSRMDPTLVWSGLRLTGATGANLLGRSVDSMLIGRVWGDVSVGLYDRALKLLLFPLQQITQPISRTAIPALSRLADDEVRYRQAFLRITSFMVIISMPGIMVLVVMAPDGVKLFLGERWAGIVPIFQVLGWVALFQLANTSAGWLLLTQGRSSELFTLNAVAAVTNIIGFVAGVSYGPIGVATGYAVAELVRTPFIWFYVCRRGPVPVSALAGPALSQALVIVAVYICLSDLMAVQTLPVIPKLAIGIVIAYGLGFGISLLHPGTRAYVAEMAAMATKMALRVGDGIPRLIFRRS